MLSKTLSTPVDELVEAVKKNNGISITNLQKKLKLPKSIIGRWLVVLEEFKIVSVAYKGLEGYVSLAKEELEFVNKKEIDLDKLKEEFIFLAKKKNFSFEKMSEAWPKFLEKYEEEIKNLFIKKAQQNGFEPMKIDTAWNKFQIELHRF